MKKLCAALMISSMMILGAASCGGSDDDDNVQDFSIEDADVSFFSYDNKQCIEGIFVNQHIDEDEIPESWPVKAIMLHVCGEPSLTSSSIQLSSDPDSMKNGFRYLVVKKMSDSGTMYASAGGKVEFTEVSENKITGTISDASFREITCTEDEEGYEEVCAFSEGSETFNFSNISINISSSKISYTDCTQENMDLATAFLCADADDVEYDD